MAKIKALLARARAGLLDILTALNTAGSILLAYALQNQDIASQILAFMPAPYRPLAGAIVPPAWWLLVQIAKARALRKAAKAG